MLAKNQLNREGLRFELPLIQEIVKKAESGLSRSKLCREYGMTYGTLGEWLKRYGSENYHASKRASFTIAERRSVVRAILQKRITPVEAQKQYKVQANTLRQWLRTFSKENETIEVTTSTQMKSKKSTTTTESEQIKALKKALAETQLKLAAMETMVDIAERELKIDIRKKSGAKQSPK